MFILRFTIYFSLSYLILSLPINQKPTFYHLHELLEPFTEQFFGEIKNTTNKGIIKSKEAAKKLFSNTLPEGKSDKINTKYSSTKKSQKMKTEDLHQESYTVEEKQFLEKILKKAQ